MNFFFIAAGLGLLFFGGELLVRGSVAIAERLGMSSLLIGLTVVAFGTSAPELLVSIDAGLRGSPDIALGNIVGSNIANVLLILGIAVLIAPIAGWQRTVARDALVMTLAALALFGLVHIQQIGRVEGVALLIVLGAYLLGSYWLEQRDHNPTVRDQE
ncbi:MAG: sodium:calcium antiporter, partial [Alphaproteobacteria bacterium]